MTYRSNQCTFQWNSLTCIMYRFLYVDISFPSMLSVHYTIIQWDKGSPLTIEDATTKQHTLIGMVSYGLRSDDVSIIPSLGEVYSPVYLTKWFLAHSFSVII